MMRRNHKITHPEYWEKNIAGFTGFYDKNSEESLIGPRALTYLYKHFIFPVERKYMKVRFNMVSAFLDEYVRPSMTVADIGCGGGIFTKQLAARGISVYALDYVQRSLDLTKGRLTSEELNRVKLMLQDVTLQSIPQVDVAIAIGVLPYLDSIDRFFKNILPYTKLFLFNFLDAQSLWNKLRRTFPLMDVRGYNYYTINDIRRELSAGSFTIRQIDRLATGFMIRAERN